MSLKDALLVGLGGLSLAWYYVCLFSLGSKPPSRTAQPSAFRQFQSLSLTSLSVSLATFIGMLLGFQQAGTEIEASHRTSAAALTEASASVGALATSARALERLTSHTLSTSDMQWAAAALYVLSLLIALYFWRRHGDATDPAVSTLGKSLLGLVGGALSILLSIKT